MARTNTRTNTEEKMVFRLRGAQEGKKRVSFTEDTVDNEHMNKKKSKKCCIFHHSNICNM